MSTEKVVIVILGASAVILLVQLSNLKLTRTDFSLYQHSNNLPTIYMITCTYRRAEQLPELIRICQTLCLVKQVLWLVSEHAAKPSPEVINYLKKCGVPFVYMRGNKQH